MRQMLSLFYPVLLPQSLVFYLFTKLRFVNSRVKVQPINWHEVKVIPNRSAFHVLHCFQVVSGSDIVNPCFRFTLSQMGQEQTDRIRHFVCNVDTVFSLMDWAFHEFKQTNRKWLKCWADTLSNCGQGRTNHTAGLKQSWELLSLSLFLHVWCSSEDLLLIRPHSAHMWKPTHAVHILGFLLSSAISSPLNHSSGLVKGPWGQGEKRGPHFIETAVCFWRSAQG